MGAIYAHRALDQMDRDMEEYERRLDEYEEDMMRADPTFKRTTRRTKREEREAVDVPFAGGTLAMDVGTTRTKLSYLSSFPTKSSSSGEGTAPPTLPTVCVDREGHRSTPSIVWLPPPAGGDDVPLFGRHAEARAYDSRGGIVLRPREIIRDIKDDDDDDEYRVVTDALRRAVRDVAANALDQALGGTVGGGTAAGDTLVPLFVRRGAERSTSGTYDVRPVFLHPASGDGSRWYRDVYAGLSNPEDIAVHVSEPVAIVTGAEHYGLLPPSSAGTTSVLVIDVGGTSTCVSLVPDDGGEVTYSATLPLGGETPIDLLVRRLAEDFYGPSSPGGGEDDGGDIDDSMASAFTTRPKLDDPAALQRLHEASVAAIRELSNKTRTEINLPYLTMDMKTRQPRHLRTDISRNVVDAAMENWVRSVLVPRLLRQKSRGDEGNVLSRALPPPTDLSTLFASAIARCLEITAQTPLALRAVLLVGGGARMPLVRESMMGCVGYLAGDTYASKRLIMPEGEMGDELGVLGGALWGSHRGR